MISHDQQMDRERDSDVGAADRRRATERADQLCGGQHMADVIYRHLRRHARAFDARPLRVLDVACRDVTIPLGWSRRLKREGCEIELTLAELSEDPYRREQIKAAVANGMAVETVRLANLTAPTPGGFDLVISVHRLHELDPHHAFRLLQTMQCSTTGPLVVCDYERSPLNRWLAKASSRLCCRSRLVHQITDDSIGNAYSIREFQRLADDALVRPAAVERIFPFHMMLVCDEQVVPEPVPAFA